MNRKILISGNWKLNLDNEETKNFLQELLTKTNNCNFEEAIEVMINPSFTSLTAAKEILKQNNSPILLGAQNCSEYSSGAYTGEISASMLAKLEVRSVILGHSERREIFGEGDEMINAKIKAAQEQNLRVIVCCGESEATREQGQTDAWIESQIDNAFENIQITKTEEVTIAYEPIWAIGTGKTCEADEANRVIKLIRNKLTEIYDQNTANQIRILYGGSVKSANIEKILEQSDIDGALIGGASIKTDEFASIIEKASNCARISNIT